MKAIDIKFPADWETYVEERDGGYFSHVFVREIKGKKYTTSLSFHTSAIVSEDHAKDCMRAVDQCFARREVNAAS